MNQEKIGNFIAERRKKKKLTQAKLAEKLGVSINAVSKWERGLNIPNVSLFKDLCNELDFNVNELLCGEKIENDKYVSCAEKNLLILTSQIEKRKRILKNVQKVLLLFAILLFISNMIFNSMYGDKWDRSNILYMGYILMTVNFCVAIIISFLNFDNIK